MLLLLLKSLQITLETLAISDQTTISTIVHNHNQDQMFLEVLSQLCCVHNNQLSLWKMGMIVILNFPLMQEVAWWCRSRGRQGECGKGIEWDRRRLEWDGEEGWVGGLGHRGAGSVAPLHAVSKHPSWPDSPAQSNAHLHWWLNWCRSNEIQWVVIKTQ